MDEQHVFHELEIQDLFFLILGNLNFQFIDPDSLEFRLVIVVEWMQLGHHIPVDLLL